MNSVVLGNPRGLLTVIHANSDYTSCCSVSLSRLMKYVLTFRRKCRLRKLKDGKLHVTLKCWTRSLTPNLSGLAGKARRISTLFPAVDARIIPSNGSCLAGGWTFEAPGMARDDSGYVATASRSRPASAGSVACGKRHRPESCPRNGMRRLLRQCCVPKVQDPSHLHS